MNDMHHVLEYSIIFFFNVAYLGELSGFRSSAFGVSVVAGCAVASLGDWCPTLRHIIVISSSLVKMSMKSVFPYDANYK